MSTTSSTPTPAWTIGNAVWLVFTVLGLSLFVVSLGIVVYQPTDVEAFVVRSARRNVIDARARAPVASSPVFIRSFDTRPLKNMIRMHVDNLTDYATHHGYNYVFSPTQPSFALKLPVYWTKLQLAKEVLESTPPGSVFMWVDTDALVVHKHVPVEHVLRESPSSSIFIGRDLTSVKLLQPTAPLNAGVFLVRNNRVGCAFVNECLDTYQADPTCRGPCGELTTKGRWAGRCYEQGVMNKVARSTKYRDHVRIMDRSVITNGKKFNRNAWISQTLGHNKAITEETMRAFLESPEQWLPVRVSLPRARSPSPVPPYSPLKPVNPAERGARMGAPVHSTRACIVLTAHATPDRADRYRRVLNQWSDARLDVPLYVGDSAGFGLLRPAPARRGVGAPGDTGPGHRDVVPYVYVSSTKKRRPTFSAAAASSSLLDEQESLRRVFEAHPEILRDYDLVFKITGDYFIPAMDAVIARIPHDTDVVLPYGGGPRKPGSKSENVEVIGMRPELWGRVLDRAAVVPSRPLERAVGEEISKTRGLKRVRLPPIPIAHRAHTARGDAGGSPVLSFL